MEELKSKDRNIQRQQKESKIRETKYKNIEMNGKLLRECVCGEGLQALRI